MSGLINKRAVKQLALDYADMRAAAGGRRFTRVSREFLSAIEADLRVMIQSRVNRHPSRGKTLT